MLDHKVLKHSLPTSAALKLLDAEDQIVAAGRAIGVVLKTMKYSHYEPDQRETKRLIAAMADLQGGFPRAAIRQLDHALEAHSDPFQDDGLGARDMPIDILIQELNTIFRLPAQ